MIGPIPTRLKVCQGTTPPARQVSTLNTGLFASLSCSGRRRVTARRCRRLIAIRQSRLAYDLFDERKGNHADQIQPQLSSTLFAGALELACSGNVIAGPYSSGRLAERAPCRAAAPVPSRRAQCLDPDRGEVLARALACPSGRHVCRLDLARLPDRFPWASRSDLVSPTRLP